MKIADKRKFLIAKLYEDLSLLDRSTEALNYSFRKCNGIGKKNFYDLEEQESFEALTSRFARTSDILTQKIIKTLFVLLQENIKTIIDTSNLMEKLEIIEQADDLINIRELRNQITHEYTEADLNALFQDVLIYVPGLKRIIVSLKDYINHNFPENTDIS